MDFENLKLKCECGGSMEKIQTEWKGIVVRGWKCKKCEEEVINPIDAQKALEIERARNVRNFPPVCNWWLKANLVFACGKFLSMLKNHHAWWDGFIGVSHSCHPSRMGGF